MQHQNLQHILCSDTHEGATYIFLKGPKIHKIQDGGMFTLKFKMAAIFVKLYMSLPIHRCIYLSNPLRIYRDSIFLKIFVIPGGMRPPKKSNGGIALPPFQIEVGGTREQPHHLAKLLHAV